MKNIGLYAMDIAPIGLLIFGVAIFIQTTLNYDLYPLWSFGMIVFVAGIIVYMIDDWYTQYKNWKKEVN